MSRGERGSQVVRIIQGIDHQDGDWLQHGHEFPQHSRREGARVVLPPKSDTGKARENKIDDVSAVLRYGVVSVTSELREHGRDDAVP
jgi:hypothetical protein